MAKDTQRDKARATFGKTFFENTKCGPAPKNSMAAQQKVANSRPIPTFKVGGVVKKADGGRAKDFTKPMMEAASRAAKKGTPVMKSGGPTKDVMAQRLTERVKAGNYKDGGDATRYEEKRKRKEADIEKDYQKALAKGKNSDVAKAKREQRMADAADDFAKWTKADRSKTSAAEKAAEQNLTMTRRAARNSPTGAGAKTSEALVKKAEASMSDRSQLSSTGPVPATKIEVSTTSKKPAAPRAKPATRPVQVRSRNAATDAKPATTTPAATGATAAAGSAPARGIGGQGGRTGTPIVAAAKDPRLAAAERLEREAAEKRKAESSPSGYNIGAKLLNKIGFGSGADLRSAANYRKQVAGQQGYKTAVATKGQRDQAAASAADAAIMKKNAERVAKLRAAGREADARFYEKNPRALKSGGIGKYAAGGAGKVRKGMMKGK